MLFDSHVFIFLFLPLTLVGFYLFAIRSTRIALFWLSICSLFFYGWWNVSYLLLLFTSITVNFILGIYLAKQKSKKIILITGLLFNIGLIFYYKYTNLFIYSINHVSNTDYRMYDIVLPLAISFFTFQQIEYLVDVYKSNNSRKNFIHYVLFVSFFPQLIAGPILKHTEIIPQFLKKFDAKIFYANFSIGSAIFLLGLLKKVIIADQLAPFANAVFDSADLGGTPTFFEAWSGTLAYSFQLYFDFSGYSDMAIGLGRMFGIHLPINFNSPYKAKSIIEFWQRWHMTLSRFLRDHIYIPLGGNHHGDHKRFRNIMITMLIGGLWHGASWTFVFWGGLHGIYIVLNHAIRKLCFINIPNFIRWSTTLLLVILAWVPFRASHWESTKTMYKSLLLLNGVSLPPAVEPYIPNWVVQAIPLEFSGMFFNGLAAWNQGIVIVLLAALLALYAPNSNTFFYSYVFTEDRKMYLEDPKNIPRISLLTWKPSTQWAFLSSLSLLIFMMLISKESQFLYFQF